MFLLVLWLAHWAYMTKVRRDLLRLRSARTRLLLLLLTERRPFNPSPTQIPTVIADIPANQAKLERAILNGEGDVDVSTICFSCRILRVRWFHPVHIAPQPLPFGQRIHPYSPAPTSHFVPSTTP